VKPLTTPIRLTFPDGIELISSIDPVTNLHSVLIYAVKLTSLGFRELVIPYIGIETV
jgi:hypothetical protein